MFYEKNRLFNTMETNALIQQQIENNNIILYMKGTPIFPQCGYSAQVVSILKECGIQDFAHINVLEHPDIRSSLPVYSKFPTFPQLYVKGELVGGCDIVTQLFETGELQKILT